LVAVAVGEQVLLQDHLAALAEVAQVPWFRIRWVLQEPQGKVMPAAAAFKEQIQLAVVVVVQPLLVVMELMHRAAAPVLDYHLASVEH
jgi:hypothetical protein